MNAIKINGLTKKFGDRTAVDNINLEIKDGELIALLGLNGAGKTTTLKMLSCLIKPTAGEAILFGDSINKNENAVKQKINVSPQETAIAPNLSVKENLEFFAEVYGIKPEEAKKRTNALVKKFGLGDRAKDLSRKLSGGFQRRLSIAMALISEPKILFLDEPTLGLDVVARRELWKIIKELKGKVTIILTTHYLEEAEELSDRICVMKDGKIMALGTAEELKKQANKTNFEDAFIGLCGEEI